MFIKWSLMLIFMSMLFMFCFLSSFFYKNLLLIEYFMTSFLNTDVKFYFMFDWISNLFTFTVLFISGMVIWYSNGYMLHDKNKVYFCVVVLLFVLSMILLILMPNIFMLILGWDGLGLVSYCLVIFYQSSNSYNSGMITVISNRVGDVMMIMSLLFFFNFGSFDISSIYGLETVCFLFIIIAGLTKSAQIPFSAWLPAAMAAPTPVSSLVHSSTLVTAGVYILIRFHFIFENETFSMFLMKISLLTMLMSGMNAYLEVDLKKIIAFSTLSQLSMMMLTISLGMKEIAFFHLILHAIFKSMLFLCAGLAIHTLNGYQDIRMLGNFFNCSPLISSCMMISVLSLMGFPFIGGFYSKDLVVEFFFLNSVNVLIILMFLLGLTFTFLYCMRLIYFMTLKGTFSFNFYQNSFEKDLIMPIFLLTFMLLISGNFFFWLILPSMKILFIGKIHKIFSLTLFMVIIYFWVKLFFYKKMTLLKSKKSSDFLYKMWFMSSLSSLIFLKGGNLFMKMTMMDWKWMELIGPKEIKTSLSKSSLFFLWANYTSFTKLLMMITMMLFLTLL
uniref:NADH-ubiquinone oxidoreductase chain 5 n=1 Tax=Bothriocroton concolor TaxID=65640 RepID=H9M730_BOTCN|nr:NADH dehydrogenase subunit 5 [Bothriocroton concolor]AET63047.1 NADH dehydrogenase subunit 5 [Bothriocroton concolor]